MIDRIGHALVDWLVSANAWTAVLLASALLLDRALARRAHASLRIALYAPVALRVLLPFSWSIPVARAPQVAMLLPLDRLSAAAAPTAASVASWPTLLAVAHVAVAVVLGLRALVRRRRLARELASARTAVAIAGPCPVLEHRELGPMVVGLVAPRIILPQAMIQGASRGALECVLRHEIAHLRRGDPWLSAAIEVMLAACWPVVPLWVAAARVRHLMELACDEAALAGADAGERRRYGHVLLDVADHGSLALAGAGSLHFGSRLRARIEAIALQRPWPRALQGTLVAVAVAGFAACSSAGPTTLPEPTGTTRPAAGHKGLDEYGYEYDSDSLHAAQAQPATPAPTATTNRDGRLAPEAIQFVVRKSFGKLRSCYETAAQKNVKLAGTVTVKFIINPDGSVRDAADASSTLPDANAIQCIVDGFSKLAYPAPEGGFVTVVYPVEFSPGD